MAGIYLHIPFCKQACAYCDFHFSTLLNKKQDLVSALCQEIKLRKDFITEPVNTIYFGGGTPSLLNQEELTVLLETIHQNFNVAELPEITLEANPDDLTKAKIKMLKQLGINRLSIGVQSFYDEHLSFMNRAHNSNEAEVCIKMAQEEGISNITADLIFGFEKLSNSEWEQNIEKLLMLNVPHVSLYALTVEPKTKFSFLQQKGQNILPSDDRVNQQYQLAHQIFSKNGYDHYEISNYAKGGLESEHNSAYWKGKPYLGIGPSAHSYNGKYRSWNVSNNPRYIESINSGKLPFEEESLTIVEQFNEKIMVGLRTKWGVNLDELKNTCPINTWNDFEGSLEDQIRKGQINKSGELISIPQEYWIISDSIISELFVSE